MLGPKGRCSMQFPLGAAGEWIEELLRWANLTDLLRRLPDWLVDKRILFILLVMGLFFAAWWLSARRSRSRQSSAVPATPPDSLPPSAGPVPRVSAPQEVG